MKSSRDWMFYARHACAAAESHVCLIRDGDPKALHRRLYKWARRAGWKGYRFAQDGQGRVVVSNVRACDVG